MRTRRHPTDFCCLLLCLMLTTLPITADAAGPSPGQHPLTPDGQMQIGDVDRCPVCAMKVAKHRKFASAIALADGTTFYFCGTGCMIRSWLRPDVYLGCSRAELRTPVVKDYFTGRHLDARTVHWVAGSDIVGPMGPALVPIFGDNELKTFKDRHGGRVVFRLDDMTAARWKQITGKPLTP